MADALKLQQLAPVGIALAVLLVSGVAAALVLHTRSRNQRQEPWSAQLDALARASRLHIGHLVLLLGLIAAAQLIRRFLPAGTLLDVAALHGVILLGAIGIWVKIKKPAPFSTPWKTAAAEIALRWLAILPVLWFTAWIWQLVLSAFGHTPEIQSIVQLFLNLETLGSRIGFVVAAILVAPITEEVLFRGLLLPILARRTGAWAATLGSSVLFGILHADLTSVAVLTVFSVTLSIAYARTRSLLVPMGIHILFLQDTIKC